MAVSAGSPTVSDVKGKLQGVLAELEKYRDLYRTTNQELEIEKDKRTKVITMAVPGLALSIWLLLFVRRTV